LTIYFALVLEILNNKEDYFHFNRTEHIRHLCNKTTVLSYHRCLINSGVEITNNNEICIGILSNRCLLVRV
jgi:hypothetical protein